MASKMPFKQEIVDAYDFMAYVTGPKFAYAVEIDYEAFISNVNLKEADMDIEAIKITEEEIEVLIAKMGNGVPFTKKEEKIMKYITSETL